MRTLRSLLSLLLLTAVASHAPAGDAPKTDPADWAPGDAVFFIGITDLDELKAAWDRTSGGRMAKDPQLKELFEQAPMSQAKLAEMFRQRLAKVLGTEPEKIVNPFGGPLAAFIAPPHEEGKTTFLRAAFVTGVKDAERMQQYYRQAVHRLRDRVSDYERQEFAGRRIDVFIRSDDEATAGQDAKASGSEPNEPASPPPTDPTQAMQKLLDELFDTKNLPPRLALCLTDKHFIAATDETLVKGVLRGWKQSHTLAEEPEYRYLLRKFEPAGQVRMVFHVRRVTDAVRKEAPEAFRFLASLGIDNVRSVLAHIRYGGKQYDARLEALVHTEGEPAGLVRIFSMPNRPVQPTAFVPDDAALYLSLNLDFPRLLSEIEKMLRKHSPEAADSFARSLDEMPTPDGQKINLREQLFANLSAPLEVIWRFLPPYGPDGVRVSLRVPIRNPDQIRALLRTLVPTTGLMERDLQGATVFDLPFGGISVGVQEGQIVAGVKAAVERAMQQAEEAQPLATSPRFRAVAGFVPEGAWFVFYFDGNRLWKAMIAMARKRKEFEAAMFSHPVAGVGAALAEAMTMTVPPDKLDLAERMTQYTTVSLVGFSTMPDGIWMRLVTVPVRGIRAERD